MYGKWLYRKSAADHIRRIQSEFPDAAAASGRAPRPGRHQLGRRAWLLVLLLVLGSAFTLLLGPNLQALLHLVSG